MTDISPEEAVLDATLAREVKHIPEIVPGGHDPITGLPEVGEPEFEDPAPPAPPDVAQNKG